MAFTWSLWINAAPRERSLIKFHLSEFRIWKELEEIVALWPVSCFGWKPLLLIPSHFTSGLPLRRWYWTGRPSPLPIAMLVWYPQIYRGFPYINYGYYYLKFYYGYIDLQFNNGYSKFTIMYGYPWFNYGYPELYAGKNHWYPQLNCECEIYNYITDNHHCRASYILKLNCGCPIIEL